MNQTDKCFDKREPRILVLTITPWSLKGEANTWSSLLKGRSPDCLANVYLRDGHPELLECSRNLCISEQLVVKGLFKRSLVTAKEYNEIAESTSSNESTIYSVRRGKLSTGFLRISREIFWRFGRWRTKELDEFIDDFKPDIILHSFDNYVYKNRVAEYIADRSGARIIGYVWDDTFTYKQSKGLLYRLQRSIQRRSHKRLARRVETLFAITPKTKREAEKFFGRECELLSKPLVCDPTPCDYSKAVCPLRMVYTGNLLIGRDRTLRMLSEALNEFNRDGVRLTLDVYTQTLLPDKVRNKIESEYCCVHPPISHRDVLEEQRAADILLFIEDIGGGGRIARLSFSTKITDYLSMGKAILALGNADLAPIEYFSENSCAAVATNRKEILPALERLCDRVVLDELSRSAVECGLKNHSAKMIRDRFNLAIESCLEERE